MIGTYMRTKKVITGDIMRIHVFPVRKEPKSRSKKRMPSRECQIALNAEMAKRRFSDLAHLNFTSEDLRLELDYNLFIDKYGRNPTAEEAGKLIAKFFRRLKKIYAEKGGELKYLYVTEIGKVKGKVHHHAIITGGRKIGIAREEIEGIWQWGYGNTAGLKFVNGSIANLAAYYLKEPITKKRWSGSRNMKRPQEEDYKDGTPASIVYSDMLMKRGDAEYIDSHLEDVDFVSKFIPGYAVSCIIGTPKHQICDENGIVIDEERAFDAPFLIIECFKTEKRTGIPKYKGIEG